MRPNLSIWLALAPLLVAAAAHAAPLLGTDAPVDQPTVARKAGEQKSSSIAYGKGKYLGVWLDGDSNLNRHAVMGALVDNAGNVGSPIVIQDVGLEAQSPAVAFDGTRFLVVWAYFDPGPKGQDIYGAYVDPATGKVTDAFPIASGPADQSAPAVSAGDGYALVVWKGDEGARGNFTIHGNLLDVHGNFLAGHTELAPLAVGGKPPMEFAAVAWGGKTAGNFLVTWSAGNPAGRNVSACTVNVDGTVSAPQLINDQTAATMYGSEAYSPTVASDGARYLVAWVDSRPDTADTRVYARFVPTDITMLANAPDFPVADGTALPMPMPVVDFIRPQITYVGAQWLVVYEATFTDMVTFAVTAELWGNRLDGKSGMPLDLAGTPISTAPQEDLDILPDTRRNVLATDGAMVYAAWTDLGGGVLGKDAFALPIDLTKKTLTRADSVILSRGANAEVGRAVATNGTVTLIVWEDTRNPAGLDIYGMRVDPATGKPLEPPFALCDAPGDQFLPSVAAVQGGLFLVAWSDGRSQVLDRNPQDLKQAEIYTTRLGSTGAPMEPNGVLLPRKKPVPPMMTDPGRARLAPTVAASPDGWFIAWEEWRNFINNTPLAEVWGSAIGRDGTPSAEPLRLVTVRDVVSNACAPSAAWNGKSWFVAYEQPCSLFKPQSMVTPNYDLLGVWIAVDGTVDATPVVVANQPDAEVAPQVTLGSDGQLMLVWRGGDEAVTMQEIRGGLLADGAHALAANSQQKIYSFAANDPAAPSVVWVPSTVAGTARGLVTWSERAGFKAVRVDAALKTLDVPFDLPSVPAMLVPYRTTTLVTMASIEDMNGARVAGNNRGVPRAAVAATASGDTVIAYDLLEQITGQVTPRTHFNRLGVLPRGAGCTSASACGDGICTGGFCCDTKCDGICQRCGVNGCNDTPPTDKRCGDGGGVIACGGLSTSCRTYRDQPLNQCAWFGECAQAGSLAECVTYTNATDGTACSESASDCGTASCHAGACLCPGEVPLSFGPRLATPGACGASIAGRRTRAPPLALLVVVLAALLLRRRPRS